MPVCVTAATLIAYFVNIPRFRSFVEVTGACKLKAMISYWITGFMSISTGQYSMRYSKIVPRDWLNCLICDQSTVISVKEYLSMILDGGALAATVFK